MVAFPPTRSPHGFTGSPTGSRVPTWDSWIPILGAPTGFPFLDVARPPSRDLPPGDRLARTSTWTDLKSGRASERGRATSRKDFPLALDNINPQLRIPTRVILATTIKHRNQAQRSAPVCAWSECGARYQPIHHGGDRAHRVVPPPDVRPEGHPAGASRGVCALFGWTGLVKKGVVGWHAGGWPGVGQLSSL
eukprot:1194369-Prorocentrum_minimum.AAC.9